MRMIPLAKTGLRTTPALFTRPLSTEQVNALIAETSAQANALATKMSDEDLYRTAMSRLTYLDTMKMDTEAKIEAANIAYKGAMNAAWLRAITTLGVGVVAALLTYLWVKPIEQKLKEVQDELAKTTEEDSEQIAQLKQQLAAARLMVVNAQAEIEANRKLIAEAEKHPTQRGYDDSFKNRVMGELALKIKNNKRQFAAQLPETDETPSSAPKMA